MNTFLSTLKSRRLLAIWASALLSIGHISAAHSAQLQVVTDIAPIHSLVSMVIGDQSGEQTDVTLLIPSSQSPHGYSLKPSQRRQLDKAQLVVILSHEFTPALSRHLKTSSKDRVVLALSSVAAHSHDDEHGHDEHSGDEHSDDEHVDEKHGDEEHEDHEDKSHDDSHQSSAASKTTGNTIEYDLENDPHAWLNPVNAIAWLDDIATAASLIDESGKTRYEKNAADAKQALEALHTELTDQLAAVRNAPYIVYHDAYQHFAKSYALQAPVAIALSDARAPGAAKIRSIKAQAENINCAFSEVQHDTSIVDLVTDKLSINRGTLDPIGSQHPIGASLYPNLMRSLANSFTDCLAN